MHHALDTKRPENAMFLESLLKYARFLKGDQVKSLRGSLRAHFENDSDLISFLETFEEFKSKKDSNDEVDMLSSSVLRGGSIFGFTEAMGHKLAGSKRSSGSKGKLVGAAAEMPPARRAELQSRWLYPGPPAHQR